VARKLDEEKRSRILEAARDAFGAEGFQKTTIKGIAQATGIAQGTMYTYFKNKEKLFDEVVEEIWQTFRGGLEKISVENAVIVEKLGKFIDFCFDLLAQIHPLLRGMYTEANRRELLDDKLRVICRHIEDLFTAPDGTPIVSGERSVETRNFNISVIVYGILFKISLTKPEDLSRVIDELKTALMRAIEDSAVPRTAL
jgi:AcrR family transcriptional regulator